MRGSGPRTPSRPSVGPSRSGSPPSSSTSTSPRTTTSWSHHDPTVADARGGSASSPAPTCRRRCRCSGRSPRSSPSAAPTRCGSTSRSSTTPSTPAASPRREAFVERVVDALRVDGLVPRTSIQCFDWGVLDRVGEAEPALARNLLVSPKYLRAPAGRPSPWFDGLAVDDDFVVTAARQGFTAISPIHGSPFRSGVDDPAYQPFATAELVDAAHAAGLAVVPYVVDDAPTMRHLVRLGRRRADHQPPRAAPRRARRRGPQPPARVSRRRRQPPAGPERLLRHDHLLPRGLARRPGGCRRPRPRRRAVAGDARDVRSRAPSSRPAPTTVLDVRGLEQGDPPAVAWSERRSGRTVIHGTGGTTHPRAQPARPVRADGLRAT